MSKPTKPKTSYQIMTSILTNYSPSREEIELINEFFFCRYLSGDPRSVFVGNFLNRYYQEIPKHIGYKLAKQLLVGKIRFIQVPKKEKNEDVTIDNISKYYRICSIEAKQYFELMDAEERNKFLLLYDGA